MPIMKKRNIFGLATFFGATFYTSDTQSNFSGTIPKREEIEERICELPLEKRLSIKEQTQRLNDMHNYSMTPEDLVYITRVTYLEAGNDPKAKSKEDLQKGWEGVAQVILNRYLFDKNHNTHLFGKNTSLRGIVEAKMQFHPVYFFPKLFDDKTLTNKEGEATLSYGRISQKKVAEVYNEVVSVLEQKNEDITDEAVFFHADYVKNGRKDGTKPFSVKKTPCRTKFTTQINTHKFFATSCPIDPYGSSTNHIEEENNDYYL